MTSSPHLDVVKKTSGFEFTGSPYVFCALPKVAKAGWKLASGCFPRRASWKNFIYGHEMPLRWWKWKCQEEWPSSGCCTCHRASGESWLAENWNHLINQPINQWLQVIALDQSKQILITMFDKNLSIEVSPKYGNVCVRACNEAYLGRFFTCFSFFLTNFPLTVSMAWRYRVSLLSSA